MLKRCEVSSNDRTVWFDESLTLQEVKDNLYNMGLRLNTAKTLRSYGLTYNDERSFTSRYRDEFELSHTKVFWDIKLSELRLYKDLLLGTSIKGY